MRCRLRDFDVRKRKQRASGGSHERPQAELSLPRVGRLLHRCAVVCTACGQATQPLPLTTLEAGGISGKFEKGLRFLVISRSRAFAELYEQIASLILPTPPTPAVDFTKYYMLVAFMGKKPTAGYSIRFAETARRLGPTVEVTVLRSTPVKDAILAQVVTNPYVIAVVAKDNYTKITFVDEMGVALASIDTLE